MHVDARGIVVEAAVGQLSPMRLVFAWANSDQVPFLLGQFNFFQAFDVCFFRTWHLRDQGNERIEFSMTQFPFREQPIARLVDASAYRDWCPGSPVGGRIGDRVDSAESRGGAMG